MPCTMINRISKFILSSFQTTTNRQVQKYSIGPNSQQAGGKVLECLTNRSILRLSGKETSDFLQGLITNDMKHLQEGLANIYSLFLNNKGRVMYDSIVYKSQTDDVYYIECDSRVAVSLEKHLKLYRVRRKIEIERLEDKMKVWSMFDTTLYSNDKNTKIKADNHKLEGIIFPCGTLNKKTSKVIDNVMIYEDPRLPELGFRILTESKLERNDIIKHLDTDISFPEAIQDYKSYRYKIGVGEGIEDLPPGKALPLEVNCDYLHGVSFHKGCYIGQELTARTYHTGVVRKRLMPLVFEKIPNESFQYDEKIVDESNKVVGKFRGSQKKYGLGLMRIKDALNAQNLNMLGTTIKISKPTWWPQESEKQIASIYDQK